MNERNPQIWAKAQELAGRGYATIISDDTLSSGETIYLAEHPELAGCLAQGYSVEEALENLQMITVDFIYYLLEDGLDVPAPATSETVTGSSAVPLKTVQLTISLSLAQENPVESPAEHSDTKMQFRLIHDTHSIPA